MCLRHLFNNPLALRALAGCWSASNHDVQGRARCPDSAVHLQRRLQGDIYL